MVNNQSLKKKYERLYNETLDKNKDILIESFIEYYGEEYRDVITSRFNEITFVYFINWESFSSMINNVFLLLSDYNNIDKYKDMRNFLEYREITNDSFEDSFVGSSNEKLIKDEFINDNDFRIKKYLIKVFSIGNPNYSNLPYDKQVYRLISLPILLSTESYIIHEINHAITSSSVAVNLVKKELIEKTGLRVGDEDITINELINERASREIYEIFKRRGGDMSAIHLNAPPCEYTENLYLIDEFYNKFKKIIKESYITLNKNYLVQRVGKENYEELVKMINKYYNKDLYLSRKNKKETKKDREKIVKKMQKRVINIEELTKEDLVSFYKELEQDGKKVRILNELPENSEEKKNFHI